MFALYFHASHFSVGSKRSHTPTGDESRHAASPPGSKSPRNSGHSSPVTVESANDNESTESAFLRHMLQLHPHRHDDFLWLSACMSLPTGVDVDPVESYLQFTGGDAALHRKLNKAEAVLLNTLVPGGRFDAGQSLIHMAFMYNRDDLLTQLTSANACAATSSMTATSSIGGVRTPRSRRVVPSSVNPDRAAQIRRMIVSVTRQRKHESVRCYAIMDFNTFFLPKEIDDLNPVAQLRLFDECIDHASQKSLDSVLTTNQLTVLEEECGVINWSLELTDRLGSHLYALWNRTQGDCLLDAVLQATYGVFDTDNMLRQALSDSLRDAESA